MQLREALKTGLKIAFLPKQLNNPYSDVETGGGKVAVGELKGDYKLVGPNDASASSQVSYINTLIQQPSVVEFLPIGEITGLKIPGAESDGDVAADTGEVLFEFSAETVLAYLFGHYLNIYVYRVMLEAKASEQSARMVAMQNATDSAAGLIKDLTLEYNNVRQTNITKELLEIAGGQLGND